METHFKSDELIPELVVFNPPEGWEIKCYRSSIWYKSIILHIFKENSLIAEINYGDIMDIFVHSNLSDLEFLLYIYLSKVLNFRLCYFYKKNTDGVWRYINSK